MASAKAMQSAQIKKLIAEKVQQKSTYARLMAAAEQRGDGEEAGAAWEKKFSEAEEEIYLLIQTLPRVSRAPLIKKYGLGWMENKR
jgi:hypothetical protein